MISIRHDKVLQFMSKAYFTSLLMSKDPSTKVCMLLLDPVDFTQITEGYNGMPRGADESIVRRHERPLKYSYYEHAERNGIYNFARHYLKGALAITTTVPTISCVRALISSGVRVLVCPTVEIEARTVMWTISLELAHECGLDVMYANKLGEVQHNDQRFVRKIKEYWQKAHMMLTLDMIKDPYPDVTILLDVSDWRVLSEGYSGFPRGINDTRKERYEVPHREHWVEGSVRNAIYNLVRPYLKGSLAIVTATTCVECSRALAAVGVQAVAYMEPDADFKQRWASSISSALSTMDELGIKYMSVERHELSTILTRLRKV